MAYMTNDRLAVSTPTLDTNAYADGDIIANTTQLADASPHGACQLMSVVVIDIDDKGGGLEIIFLRSNTSMGTINNAPSISDANARDEIIGHVVIDEYIDQGGWQMATKTGIGLTLKPGSGGDLYYAVISDGNTETYTAGGLTFKFGLVTP